MTLLTGMAVLGFSSLLTSCGNFGLNPSATPTPSSTPWPSPSASPTPVVRLRELPITLPMLDALFFVDRHFSERLKSELQLSDEQVATLRQTVRAETSAMRANESDEDSGRTMAAGKIASEKLSSLLGPEKAEKLSVLALQRWAASNDAAGEDERPLALATPALSATLDPRGNASSSPSPSPSASATGPPAVTASPGAPGAASVLVASAPYSAPADTRIVVNAPAYRMDVFQDGRLIKSYKISIGYPEFPLPTGMRKATSIIFNPTWTTPDEPWVESSKNLKVGQKVAAGDKLNPLGPIKIPIGLPSLIHGGKRPARIGTFGSHGCVGLTNEQVKSFTQILAEIGGLELSEADIARYEKTPTQTKSVKLPRMIPVELRYETVTVEDGKLHLYRDVYGRESKAGENLETALGMYGISMADLSEDERARVAAALDIVSGVAPDKTAAAKQTADQKRANRQKQTMTAEMTKQFRQKKEITVDIASIAGKGYPSPVDLDGGKK